ncbi:MAG: hypothetical protein II580_04990 [Bacteroidales bacterium]|nr:hypothetical protein [Bacteroidales bacterium]
MDGKLHRQGLRSGMTVLCIAIFLFSYVNATMFWHGHDVSGNWIIHSHISTKAHRSAPESNTHTATQLLLIQSAGAIACTEDAVVSYEMEPVRPVAGILFQHQPTLSSPSSLAAASLRGPPALV